MEGDRISTKFKLIAVFTAVFIFLAIIIVVWYSARQAGKAKGSINLSAPVIDASGAVSASVSDIKIMVQKLYNDMNGFNLLGHDMEVWQDFLTLSDADFISVYNQFNTLYQKDSGQTLNDWVSAENSTLQSDFGPVKNAVLQKMAKLSLK